MAMARFYIVYVLCHLFLATAASASVKAICRKIAPVEDGGVSEDCCVRILNSDPASATAEERDIAAIVGKLASRNLAKRATNGRTVPSNFCRGLYSDAAGRLLADAAAAGGGRYSDAKINFNFCMDVVTCCENGFWQYNIQRPSAVDDLELYQICAIGAALTYSAS